MSGTTFITENGERGSISVKGSLETIWEYYSPSGRHFDRLSSEDLFEVYCQGDGFGDCRVGERREWLREHVEGGYDWSHLRDSSPESLSRVLGEICRRQK